MNDEIKEILEILKKCYDLKDEHFDNYISLYQLGLLLDYITNLQKTNKNHSKKLIELGDKITNLRQENQTLHENNQNMQEEMARVWKENERLKETNVYCNRTDCIGRIKNSRKYDSVYQEKEDYKSRCEKINEILKESPDFNYSNDYIILKKKIEGILQGENNE